MADLHDEILERVRVCCQGFPEVSERLSHDAPAWFVREKRAFAYCWIDGHHEEDPPHLWLAAPPGLQEAHVEADSAVFFRPPYVGHRGWLGVRLGPDTDWTEVADLCEEAYRTVAPVKLVRLLDGGG